MNMQISSSKETVLAAWQAADALLDAAKANEMELRKEAFALYFPDATEGTNNTPLDNGWKLKGVRTINYKLDKLKAKATFDALCAVGNEGVHLAGLLFNWSAALSTGEYKKLDMSLTDHKAAKNLIDEILTTSPGAPSLEIIAPKK